MAHAFRCSITRVVLQSVPWPGLHPWAPTSLFNLKDKTARIVGRGNQSFEVRLLIVTDSPFTATITCTGGSLLHCLALLCLDPSANAFQGAVIKPALAIPHQDTQHAACFIVDAGNSAAT